jgi:hypothetical protein
LLPDFEKDLTCYVVGVRGIVQEPQYEAVDLHPMARVEDLHCEPLAGSNPVHELFIRTLQGKPPGDMGGKLRCDMRGKLRERYDVLQFSPSCAREGLTVVYRDETD